MIFVNSFWFKNRCSDVDVTAFINATGITNSTIISALCVLVTSLKNNGLWTKLNAIYPMVGGTAATHKFNLKNPLDTNAAFRLSFIGGWTHSATGALPNGTNAYANTFINPSLNLLLNNHSFGIYSRTNNIVGNQIYGAFDNTFALQQNIVLPGSTQGGFTSGNSGFLYPINTFSMFIATRTSSTSFKAFRATALLGGSLVPVTSLPNTNFLLSARLDFSAGTAIRWFNRHQLAFAFLGEGLSDTESTNFYNIVQAFQTTLSRNV
jgi:hypothetical protein